MELWGGRGEDGEGGGGGGRRERNFKMQDLHVWGMLMARGACTLHQVSITHLDLWKLLLGMKTGKAEDGVSHLEVQ